MNALEAVEAARSQLEKTANLKTTHATSIKKQKNEWYITLEAVEKKSIPEGMDLLGIYEVILTEKGELVSFERKGMRTRGSTEIKEIIK